MMDYYGTEKELLGASMKRTQKSEPRTETKVKMLTITRPAFLAIVNKAIKTPSTKPAPRSA
jgi:hypothetical protein